MILIAKLDQHRRDFTGKYKCQFCEHEEKRTGGYDDDNYHENVIPRMKCSNPECGKSTESEQDETAVKAPTRHPAGMQV
jgi:hypothetical protein